MEIENTNKINEKTEQNSNQNKTKKSKLLIWLLVIVILIVVVAVLIIANNKNSKNKLISVKNEKDLEKIADYYYNDNSLLNFLCIPFSVDSPVLKESHSEGKYNMDGPVFMSDSASKSKSLSSEKSSNNSSSSVKSDDYSKTNIQVENVDESDVLKTDGKYIYSISGRNIIISDVADPTNMKIVAKIQITEELMYPVELEVYNDKLAVICEDGKENTYVVVYDIQDASNPKRLKRILLENEFVTTRCIDGKLYIITNGELDGNSSDGYDVIYKEDGKEEKVPYQNLKYFKENITDNLVEYAEIDLNNPTQDIQVYGYFVELTDVYCSENNLYILKTNSEIDMPISERIKIYFKKVIFNFKGIIGYEDAMDEVVYDNEKYNTAIYKFKLNDDKMDYIAKTEIKGNILDRYSVDEYGGNLRVASYYSNKGTKVYVLNENLETIGQTPYIARNESMYSARFIKDKGYLITYKNVDPLTVVDLTNPQAPKVTGDLEISGYSTYLHPYDETHLIGIGMDTETVERRNPSTGRIIGTNIKVTGMKMALFDVSDIENPKVLSSIHIGDTRTTSAILTNPKALLFSKEKELIAIPINVYSSNLKDITVSTYSDGSANIDDLYDEYNTSIYKLNSKEGYLVLNINLQNGITSKGMIEHDDEEGKYNFDVYNKYSKTAAAALLRGVYIDNNLYTVSQNLIKSFNLDNLNNLGKLNIVTDKKTIVKDEEDEEDDENDDDNYYVKRLEPVEKEEDE